MPRAHYTAEGGTYRVAGHSFEPGDIREVDRELATYLSDHDDFEVTIEKDSGDATEDESSAEEDPDDESEADSRAFDVDGYDSVDDFLDRTPVGDVADDVRVGLVDDYLDAVADTTDRTTVQDAVGERRAELEG